MPRNTGCFRTIDLLPEALIRLDLNVDLNVDVHAALECIGTGQAENTTTPPPVATNKATFTDSHWLISKHRGLPVKRNARVQSTNEISTVNLNKIDTLNRRETKRRCQALNQSQIFLRASLEFICS
ncbi:hypothetical protein T265_11563 [Opisthorchis viverrini]|uniref:Uncharacterized protein n=1 Tax=Opisthorchis viverrini TaxID=6198 RepID=A0A074YYM5_OPIVI|nr:hypothetical protein T265_11563 [Opisthorchis viverrini]KER19753.1 hypothetical protein T265_11563 [Opisthorchis viverrini]